MFEVRELVNICEVFDKLFWDLIEVFVFNE